MNSDAARLLPEIFRRTLRPGTPLTALLETMDALLRPCQASLERIDAVFDPARTPEGFVEFLATWVDLNRLWEPDASGRSAGAIEPGRLRQLIANASELSQWRGTRRGLLRFLSLASGQAGFEIIEGETAEGRPKPFHLLVRAPAAARLQQRLIETILEQEKPAYTTYEIVYFEPEGGP